MALTNAAVERRLVRNLAREAHARVRRAVQSETLRDALALQRGNRGGRMWLGVPHYWAVFYHDGRRGFGPRSARVLVWFKNPAEDPRYGGKHAVRRSEVRRLSKAEFYNALRANKIVVARRVRSARARPFFRTGLRGFFSTGGGEIASTTFRRTAREIAPEAFLITRRNLRVVL